MNSLELTDKRCQVIERIESIIKQGESEQRKLNDTEDTEIQRLHEELTDIDDKLKQIDEDNKRNLDKQTDNNTIKTHKRMKYSILKAINEELNGKQYSDETRAMLDAGAQEFKSAGITYNSNLTIPMEVRADITTTTGDPAIIENKEAILLPLRERLVLAQAGANYLTGIQGEISIPVYSGSNVAWAGEVATATAGEGTFSEITLKPKRLTTKVSVSKAFLTQTSEDVENMLRNDILNAVAAKLESTILSDTSGTTGAPTGLFTASLDIEDITAGSGATANWDLVVDMEAEVENNNTLGNVSYVMSPKAKAALKKSKAIEGKFVLYDNEVNGYPALSTSAVKTDAKIICGAWNDLVIAQFGGIEVTVDPYTSAADGKVNLILNSYFDFAPRRKESFAIGTLKA